MDLKENSSITAISFLLILCLAGPLSLDVFNVPFSLQSMIIFMTPFLFKRKVAVLIIIAYLFMGAIGVPVFSGYTSGWHKLTGYTAGFLWGFLLIVWVLTYFKDIGSWKSISMLIFSSHLILLIIGFSYLKSVRPETDIIQSIAQMLPMALLKSIIAAYLIIWIKGKGERKLTQG